LKPTKTIFYYFLIFD